MLAEDQETNLRIGKQIRDLRKAKQLTLASLAEKLDCSVGYLSQIERGKSVLPIPLLQSISEALEVNITWFFHTKETQAMEEMDYVVRQNSRRYIDFSGTGIHEELLSPSLSGDLLMILSTFAPGVSTEHQQRQRKGEEAGYIESGSIELNVGEKSFNLQAGDSFSIRGEEPHSITNPSKTDDAVVVWVITPPNY